MTTSRIKETIGVGKAAEILGVSSATIRNWVKAGHLTPLDNQRVLFDEEDVMRVKNDLSTGKLSRLRQRANKTKSKASFIPMEYSDNALLLESIIGIRTAFLDERLNKDAILFFAALKLLESHGQVTVQNDNVFERVKWKRRCVKNEMESWRQELPSALEFRRYYDLVKTVTHIDENDYLGILKQALFFEGEKSKAGAYYTPTQYVDDALAFGKQGRDVASFLDPCCGTGKYLIYAIKQLGLKPEACYGFDVDETAVHISRINMFLSLPKGEFTPQVFCQNVLTEIATGDLFCDTNSFRGHFDFIATNPPWGAEKNSATRTGAYDFKESFSLFLAKSYDLLKHEGRLSFLLPESFLNIKGHSNIRKFILDRFSIESISVLGRGFSGVFTGAIRLDAIKKKTPITHRISIQNNGQSASLPQSLFLGNKDYIIDLSADVKERDIIKKIYSIPYTTLHDHAEWALGVVTGNNEKYLMESHEKGAEPIFRGSDVQKYTLGQARSFIRFDPSSYQQVAPERLYRSKEKIIYKFITKKLAFAYDDRQSLTLNSANLLIPHIDGMSIKVVLAFLNSTVFQYIFEKKYSTHKVLRGDLEQMPLPEISRDTHCRIEELVNLILYSHDEASAKQLDQIVFSCFPSLNKQDVSSIINAVNPQ